MIRAGREVSPESVCTLGMSKMYVIEFLCVMELFEITPYTYINSSLKFEIMATQLSSSSQRVLKSFDMHLRHTREVEFLVIDFPVKAGSIN